MPLPINTLDKNVEADSVLRHLKVIDREAQTAKSMANEDIINLYFRIVRASTKFEELAVKGLTIEVLGPVLGDKLGVVWSVHEPDFVSLKNVDGPAFVAFVLANQTEICQQEFNGDRLVYSALSEATKANILPLITNISNLFEI